MLIKVKCKECGNEMITEDFIDKEDYFCSPECRYQYETGYPGEEY